MRIYLILHLGIKRGIVEMSDIILINKSDGDLLPSARRTASDYTSALKFMRPRHKNWKPRVCLISSKLGTGLDKAWEKMTEFKNKMIDNGDFYTQRSNQRKKWMWNYINSKLLDVFNHHYSVRDKREQLEKLVVNQSLSPGEASDVLISEFVESYKSSK